MTTPLENVDFNLDEVKIDKPLRPDFTARVNGRVIHMADPHGIDWREILDIDDPIKFLKYALSDKVREGSGGGKDAEDVSDKEFMRNQPFEAWKFGKLVEAYMQHFDFNPEDAVGAAKRF